MSTENGENKSGKRPLEDIALDGLHLAQADDYGENFQRILDVSGAGLPGPASPEGLVLKALYHQHRNIEPAHGREESALQEIADIYNGVYGELSSQVTPVVILGLAVVLQRASRPNEQELIANALEATAQKLRATGYIYGK